MRSEDLRHTISVLRRVVGRSDEVFHRVVLGDGYIGATDGCLKAVRKGVGINGGGAFVPLEVFRSFLRRSFGDVRVGFEGEDLVVRSGSAKLIVKNPERGDVDVEVDFSGRVDLKRFRRNIDFVSRPLEEDEPVEIYPLKRGDLLVLGRSFGISATAIVEAEVSGNPVSIPYQSVRRLVKALEDLSGEALVGLDDSLGISVGNWVFSICGEKLEGSVSVPKPFEGFRMEIPPLLKILDIVADTMRVGKMRVVGSRIEIRGKSEFLELSDEIDLEIDTGFEIEVDVPFRKFRSYLSNIGGRYVVMGFEWGVFKIASVKFERYVFLRGRSL